MKNSTLMVYSIIRNIDDFIKKDKDIDIFKLCHIVRFKKASKYYIENSKRIYSDIENRYYTLKDLSIYLLYRYLIGEKKINLYNIKPDDVIETLKMFTSKRLNEDLHLLKEIHIEFNFKGIDDFFALKEDGTNIVFLLTKKGTISPIFFIRNLKKALTDKDENAIISREYMQFVKIANKIKETIKGGFFR